MKKGKIIWLNGVSSSGKTTIAKTLQKISKDSYLYLSHDLVNEMNDPKLFNISFKDFESDNSIILAKLVKSMSDNGYNVIADSVFVSNRNVQNANVFPDTIEILKENPMYFIKLECPPEELAKRELKRGDRHIGQAIAQLMELIPIDGYHYVVQNFNKTPEESANEILENINNRH